jgi:hypothetical protein
MKHQDRITSPARSAHNTVTLFHRYNDVILTLSLLADHLLLTLGICERQNKYNQSDHTVKSAISNMTQIELSITKVTLALAPNSSILSKPHPPPLILARQPVSRQRTSAIYAALPPAVVTDELTPSI